VRGGRRLGSNHDREMKRREGRRTRTSSASKAWRHRGGPDGCRFIVSITWVTWLAGAEILFCVVNNPVDRWLCVRRWWRNCDKCRMMDCRRWSTQMTCYSSDCRVAPRCLLISFKRPRRIADDNIIGHCNICDSRNELVCCLCAVRKVFRDARWRTDIVLAPWDISRIIVYQVKLKRR